MKPEEGTQEMTAENGTPAAPAAESAPEACSDPKPAATQA